MDKFLEWVSKNHREDLGSITLEEAEHIAASIESIHRWYYEDLDPGEFITAVVNNQLVEAFAIADSTNMKFMYMYPMYLYNEMPAGWRDKALRERCE